MRFVLPVAGAIVLTIVALLWWPRSLSGQVMTGPDGAPLEGVRVQVNASVLKPWWPLAALAWGHATSTVHSVTRTNSAGRYMAWFFSGPRLTNAQLRFSKRGFAIAPVINGGSGSLAWYADDDVAPRPVFAWSVSAASDLDDGAANVDIAANGREQQGSFGRRHTFWLKAGSPVRGPRPGDLPVEIRWVSARLQHAPRLGLTAPTVGYQERWQGNVDCADVTAPPTHFYLRSAGDYFGVVALDLFALCRPNPRIRVLYRFNHTAGERGLANAEELRLASGSQR